MSQSDFARCLESAGIRLSNHELEDIMNQFRVNDGEPYCQRHTIFSCVLRFIIRSWTNACYPNSSSLTGSIIILHDNWASTSFDGAAINTYY